MAHYERQVIPAQGAIDASAQKSDTVNLTHIARALYIGGAGDAKVTMGDGTVATFTALAAGTIYPLTIKRLWSTGTTATAVLALY